MKASFQMGFPKGDRAENTYHRTDICSLVKREPRLAPPRDLAARAVSSSEVSNMCNFIRRTTFDPLHEGETTNEFRAASEEFRHSLSQLARPVPHSMSLATLSSKP